MRIDCSLKVSPADENGESTSKLNLAVFIPENDEEEKLLQMIVVGFNRSAMSPTALRDLSEIFASMADGTDRIFDSN